MVGPKPKNWKTMPWVRVCQVLESVAMTLLSALLLLVVVVVLSKDRIRFYQVHDQPNLSPTCWNGIVDV
jgi:hypothetical protein